MKFKFLLFTWLLGLYWYLVIFYGQNLSTYLKSVQKLKFIAKNSNLVTTTPYYTKIPPQITEIAENPWSQGKWELAPLRSNQEFKKSVAWTKIFEQDDTQYVSKGNSCHPEMWGLSKDQAAERFPKVKFQDCGTLIDSPEAEIHLDMTRDTFQIDCNGTAQYVLQNDIALRNYVNTTNLDNSEYVLATWNDSKNSSPIKSAVFSHRKNETLYQNYLDKAEKNRKIRQNMLHQTQTESKPMLMILLSLDSMSRNQFFRQLPQTLKYLHWLNIEGKYAAFDFKIHNIAGSAFAENFYAIFTNQTHVPSSQDANSSNLIQDSALWNKLREAEFITFYGTDKCSESNGFGEEFDIFPNNFYWALDNLGAINQEGKQNWIGDKMSHFYLLNYTLSAIEGYPEANQFLNLHIRTAHDQTGQLAATLDADIHKFLQDLLEKFSDRYEIVVFFQGDHGLKYGSLYSDIQAQQEFKLPGMFLIASGSILDEIHGSWDSLWHNTVHLTTHKDIRKTILSLAGLSTENEAYLEPAVDLIKERAKFSRTCEEVGIYPWLCACVKMTEVDRSVFDKNDINYALMRSLIINEFEEIVKFAIKQSVTFMNRANLFPYRFPWVKLKFSRILRIYASQLTPQLEQVQVTYTVEQSEQAEFELIFIFGTSSLGEFAPNSIWRQKVLYLGYKSELRIVSLERKDSPEEFCETLSKEHEKNTDYCICDFN